MRPSLLLFSFLLVCGFSFSSFAGPSCIDKSKKCDPDMLCTFKSEYYAKLVGFISYAMNDPRTKKLKNGNDGVHFDGGLRQASIDEAIQSFPNKTKSEQLAEAGQIFQKKIARLIQTSFEEPTCRHGGKFNPSLAPPEGYKGMFTNESCEIKVAYYDQEIEPDNFINNGTACLEFYQRDLAHEKIHQKLCKIAEKKKTSAKRLEIDNLIAEETDAYQHSVRLSDAYMRLLNLRCSSQLKDPKAIKKQMSKINDLLKPSL